MEDGTLLKVRQRGDEFFNWTEAPDGFAVARGASGRWQYARREKGRWVPSGMTPQQRGLEGRAINPPLSTLSFAAAAEDGSALATTLSAAPVAALATTPSPAKLLVILVSFADKSITTDASAWSTQFFGMSGKTVSTYYMQASKTASGSTRRQRLRARPTTAWSASRWRSTIRTKDKTRAPPRERR